MKLNKRVEEALSKAARVLDNEVESKLIEARESESDPIGRVVLDNICLNIEEARSTNIPLCQDTGMFIIFVEIGRGASVNLSLLEKEILLGAENAAINSYYRKSVVKDPLYNRENTQTNMPPVIYYELIDSNDIYIHFLLKGFGSENCSSIRMLNPTASEDDVVNAVVDTMKKAGGKPCPPVFLGLGIGGTMDKAAVLSKKALLRSGCNSDPKYRALEERIKSEVNKLNIGPGGLGGDNSCLSVNIEAYPTHIAGLPLAISVNCHQERRVTIKLEGGFDGEN